MGVQRNAWACGLRLVILSCAILIAITGGCGSIQVRVMPDSPRRAEWAVWVLPFDDSEAEHAATDYTIYGGTEAQGCGSLLGRKFAAAFAAAEGFRAIDRAAGRRLMRQERLSVNMLAGADEGLACRLGRKLGADMVVLGRVLTYRSSWFLLIAEAEVDLEVRGLDVKSGRELWTARVRRRAFFKQEAKIAAGLAQETADAVGKRLFTRAVPLVRP